MKTIYVATALAVAFPAAVAHAQTAPAPAPAAKEKCCCEEMKGKMDCCKDKAEADAHSGHDMSQHQQPQQH